VNDFAYVKVTDTGKGIEEQHISQIFNRFYRVDVTGSRLYGGTGLGLTIARNITEQHGGSISLANHPEGGLEVTLMLPAYYPNK